MSRRSPRGLTSEESALWDKVRRQATPLHPIKPGAQKSAKLPEILNRDPIEPPTIPPFEIGSNGSETALPGLSKAAAPEIKMDRKVFAKIKRGKHSPEARLDLHGMTLAQAHPALNQFIGRAFGDGLRLVLVITGKGKGGDTGGPIPAPRGVLRRQVPMWLSQAPLSSMVLQVTDAHMRHGGEGALYVYLRRRK